MKRFIFLFLVVISLATSCTDHNVSVNSCAVADPVKDLPWLATEVESMSQSQMAEFLYIVQSTYQSQTVFVFGNCCPNCLSANLVFNCAGERVQSSEIENFGSELLRQGTIIWKGENSSCRF